MPSSPDPHSTGPAARARESGGGSGATLDGRLRAVGADLGRTLSALLAAVPGSPHRPGQLAANLGVNRAVASRVLGATAQRDALEVLHRIPGPEPLRRLVRSATRKGAPTDLAAEADAAIAAFDALIRNEAGTRSALDAMIASNLPGARDRFELASKYSVYKGLSQLKGVQAEHWLGVAVVLPSPTDELKHDLTWLTGSVAMQRLRPGVTVRFSYRHRRQGVPGDDQVPPLSVVSLDDFCVNPPARLETRTSGAMIRYTLPDDLLGPHEVVDMFVVDHHPAAINRYAKDAPRHSTSLFVEPAIPVGSLVFDAILHEEVFAGSDPKLLVYDTGYDGIANVNDEARDIDRVDVNESIEFLGHDMRRFGASEIPRYSEMLMHLADRFGWDPARFRGYRTRIRYPVYGWQVCLAFEPPGLPGSPAG